MEDFLSRNDALYYPHREVCHILDHLLSDDDFVERICHGKGCGWDGGSCIFSHDISHSLSPNSIVTIHDDLDLAIHISLEELYYYLNTACQNYIDDGQYTETIELFCEGLEFFRNACGIKGTAQKLLYRPDIHYVFYEDPLRMHRSCCETEREQCGAAADKTKTVQDINKLEWEAEANGDYALARLDYEILFKLHCPYLYACNNGSLKFTAAALPYGGRVAVLRECIKRSAEIKQLLDFEGINLENSSFVKQDVWWYRCSGSDALDFVYDGAEKPASEQGINRLKNFRKQVVTWQLNRMEPATGEDADSQSRGTDE